MKVHKFLPRRLLCLFCAIALLLSAAVFVSAEEIDYVDYFAALDKDPDVELVGSLSGELYRLLLLNPQGFMEELAFCSAELQQAVINGLMSYCSGRQYADGVASLKAMEEIHGVLYHLYLTEGMTKSEEQLLEAFSDALYYEYWRYPVQYRTDYAAMFQDLRDVQPNGAGTEYRYIDTEMCQSLCGNPAAFLEALAEESEETQDMVFKRMCDSEHAYYFHQVTREILSLLGNEDTTPELVTQLTDAQKALRERFLEELPELTERNVVASGPVAEELAERNAQKESGVNDLEPTETAPADGQSPEEEPKPESGVNIWITLGAALAAAALGFLLGRKKKAA